MTNPSFSRHGAMDLSALTQQVPAGQQAVPGASYVVEVTETNFESVMRLSLQHPVVVELYSPRVEGGQALSDALVQLANEAGGRYLLGRVNVDVARQIPAALGVQAVPTVVGVVGGQLAPLFQGVIDKAQAGQMIEQLMQAAIANGIVGRAQPVSREPEPEAQPEQPADPRFAAADAAIEAGDFALARDEFDKVLQQYPGDKEALAGRAQAGLLARTMTDDPAAVLATANTHPDDVDAQLAAADHLLVDGRAAEAFNRLILLVRGTSGDERNRVRERLLELFETQDPADPVLLDARRGLMSALF